MLIEFSHLSTVPVLTRGSQDKAAQAGKVTKGQAAKACQLHWSRQARPVS